MLVSVVIPAYNEEKYLARCLRALKRQHFDSGRVEIIVVDSASTDGTAALAQEHGVRLIQAGPRGPGRGVAYARQRGLEGARAPIVFFTDADTILPPNWISSLYQPFQDPEVVGVFGPYAFYDGSLLERLWGRYATFLNLAFFYYVLRRPHFAGQNFAVRRAMAMAIGGFDVSLPSMEDADLGLRISKRGRTVFLSRIVVPASSRRMREGKWRLIKRAIKGAIMYFLKRRPEDFAPIR